LKKKPDQSLVKDEKRWIKNIGRECRAENMCWKTKRFLKKVDERKSEVGK
jgi:hypothetical protein